jgi:hypothetical protein
MFSTDREFEVEVLRIARLLWPSAAYSGSSIEIQQERDGIFVTREIIHLIEATTSRRRDKAQHDLEKLIKLAKSKRAAYPSLAVKAWFITSDEPTADQRSVGNYYNSRDDTKGLLNICSYHQFRAQLVDSLSYINTRSVYAFGSMRDPNSKTTDVSKVKYIPLPIIDRVAKSWSVDEITDKLITGKRFIITGDYGSGKSTTMREIYFRVADRFRRNTSRQFPILLNLRDHFGQDDPAEAMQRHATKIGFRDFTDLVRAWRAGEAILLLDGFDELAMPAMTRRLKDIRRESMKLVRQFVSQSHDHIGIAISGRAHYFDTLAEMESSLSLQKDFNNLSINPFTSEQMEEYLNRVGWKRPIPDWLPSRPLLLGYLASRKFLEDVLKVSPGVSPALGWNELLTRICEREADMEVGLDGATVRKLIERLATKARSVDGLRGALFQQDLVDSFQKVCGYPPEDRGLQLLLRLPGLGTRNEEDGSREFVDQDFAATAAAGDIVHYILDPYSYVIGAPTNWSSTLGQLGLEVAKLRCTVESIDGATISNAAFIASKRDGFGVLCADILEINRELGNGYTGQRLEVHNAIISRASIGEAPLDYSRVTYNECYFHLLDIDVDSNKTLYPHYVTCFFSSIVGYTSKDSLPKPAFSDSCEIESFGSSSETGAAILALDLPMGTRVVLSLLEKLYLQPGSGRQDSALRRGLNHRAKMLVKDALELLQKEELVIKASSGSDILWIPVRSKGALVRKLVAAPDANDILLSEAAKLE